MSMSDFNGCKPFIDFLFKVQPELSEFMIKKLLFCFVLIFYPLSEERMQISISKQERPLISDRLIYERSPRWQ